MADSFPDEQIAIYEYADEKVSKRSTVEWKPTETSKPV